MMNDNPEIYFRANSSSTIGLGHLMRLVALAEMLKENFTIVFILEATNEFAIQLIKSHDFQTITIPEIDKTEEAEVLKTFIKPNCIFVADGYDFTEQYFSSIQKFGLKTVFVADFVQPMPFVDLVINHAEKISSNDYAGGGQIHCLGAKYALIRKPFLQNAKIQKKLADNKSAFICFGGADTFNLSEKILLSLLNLKAFKKIAIVVAPTLKTHSAILRLQKENSEVVTVYNSLSAEKMANLMVSYSVAFVPSSSLSYEVCSSQMLVFSGYFVDNQQLIHKGLVDSSCVFNLGDLREFSADKFQIFVSNQLKNIEQCEQQLKAQKLLFDGDSGKRFLKTFKELTA